jgi:hypothetical protein
MIKKIDATSIVFNLIFAILLFLEFFVYKFKSFIFLGFFVVSVFPFLLHQYFKIKINRKLKITDKIFYFNVFLNLLVGTILIVILKSYHLKFIFSENIIRLNLLRFLILYFILFLFNLIYVIIVKKSSKEFG